MSLFKRLYSKTSKASTDPGFEKEQQKLMAVIKEEKEQVKTYRQTLNTNLSKKKLFKEDYEILKQLLVDADKYLEESKTSSTATKEDIKAYIDELLGDTQYLALARASIEQGSIPGAFGKRREYRQNILISDQILEDNPIIAEKQKEKPKEKTKEKSKGKPETLPKDAKAPTVAPINPVDEISQEIVDFIKFYKKYFKTKIDDKEGLYHTEIEYNELQSSFLQEVGKKLGEFKVDDRQKLELKFVVAKSKLEKNDWVINSEEGAKKKALLADKKLDEFSVARVMSNSLTLGLTIAIIFILIFLLGISASYAVNLNVYKPVPYRILFAVYGFLYAIIVFPYVLLYRWFWLKKRPSYYGFIPIIPRFFTNKTVQFLLGWLTYKPDNSIWDLEEWRQKIPHDQASA